jgi:hypothetical protein
MNMKKDRSIAEVNNQFFNKNNLQIRKLCQIIV